MLIKVVKPTQSYYFYLKEGGWRKNKWFIFQKIHWNLNFRILHSSDKPIDARGKHAPSSILSENKKAFQSKVNGALANRSETGYPSEQVSTGRGVGEARVRESSSEQIWRGREAGLLGGIWPSTWGPLVDRQTDTTENTTFPQTTNADGNKVCSNYRPVGVPVWQYRILSRIGGSSTPYHLIQIVHNVVYDTIRINKPIDVLEYLGPEEKTKILRKQKKLRCICRFVSV